MKNPLQYEGVFAKSSESNRGYHIEQQMGMPFIIMQQEQPALIIFIMQSQQA
jgi:hypothetical protein